jgi:hypothetical protein
MTTACDTLLRLAETGQTAELRRIDVAIATLRGLEQRVYAGPHVTLPDSWRREAR